MHPAQSTFSKVLGMRATDPLSMMSAVEHGLPLAALDRVVQAVAPADNKFAFRIVSRPTLARRRKALSDAKKPAEGRLSPEESARLARLASAWAVALDVWGSPQAAQRFMFNPHMLLRMRPPIDLVLENEFGRQAVEGMLGALQNGSAV